MPTHPAFERVGHRPWPLPERPWTWRQSWCDLLFAHWPMPATAVRRLVPASVEVQEYGGTSWVGLVPFRMEGVAPRGMPDVPGMSAFPEMNLRVYVTRDGKPGVWFISLDAANRLAVWGGRRFFDLPYFLARMRVAEDSGQIVYASERRSAGARVAFRGRYAPASDMFAAEPGTLDHFLTERYCLYAQAADGTLWRTDVHHRPWPLQHARLEVEENAVAEPQGIALHGSPLLHFSRRLDVVVWNPERVT